MYIIILASSVVIFASVTILFARRSDQSSQSVQDLSGEEAFYNNEDDSYLYDEEYYGDGYDDEVYYMDDSETQTTDNVPEPSL